MTDVRAEGDLSIEVVGAGKRYVKYDDSPMLVSHLLQLRSRPQSVAKRLMTNSQVIASACSKRAGRQ